MSNNILINGSIAMRTVNTPTRVGQRVSTESDIANISTPFIGMIIYIEDQDSFVYVKSLKNDDSGIFEIENALINEYAPFVGGSIKGVQDITVSGDNIIVTYSNGSSKSLQLSTNSGAIINGGTYTSEIKDKNVTMTTGYGDFKVGTKVSSLEGKSYDELFDGILFPTINPVFVDPSASIILNNYDAIQEVGSVAPDYNNFIVSFNPGQIKLNNIKQEDRAGSQILENSYIFYGGSISNKQLPTSVSLGDTNYQYHVEYEAGPQPKNNKGLNFSTPLKQGSIDSSIVKVNGTFPWYASTVISGILTKQALIAWDPILGSMQAGITNIGFELKPHTQEKPQMFKTPRQVVAGNIQMYNAVAKQFENVAISDWEETVTTEKINGVDKNYYTYTYKGANRSSVKLIIKF